MTWQWELKGEKEYKEINLTAGTVREHTWHVMTMEPLIEISNMSSVVWSHKYCLSVCLSVCLPAREELDDDLIRKLCMYTTAHHSTVQP